SPEQITKAGETISYSFAVTNTGNIALHDITINEGDFSGTGTMGDITCPEPAAGVAPGDSITCTADYVATQADVDAGTITTTATAAGTTPGGTTADSAPSAAAVEAPAAPGLDLVKSADQDKLPAAG